MFCVQGVHVMASSWPATAYMLHRKEVPALLRSPLVHDISRRMGKRPAQIFIRWALQHGTSVSPKAGSHEHVQVIAASLCYIQLCLLL
jgi:diketogulonate reductase-like aldo/keto reductase